MSRSDDPAHWDDGQAHPNEGDPQHAHPNAHPQQDAHSQTMSQNPYSQPVTGQNADPNSYAPQTQQPYPPQAQQQPQNYGQPAGDPYQGHAPAGETYPQPTAHDPYQQSAPDPYQQQAGQDPYQQQQPQTGYPPQLDEIAQQVQAANPMTGHAPQPPQGVPDPYATPAAGYGQDTTQHHVPSQHADPYAQQQQPLSQPAHGVAQQTADELQAYLNQQYQEPAAPAPQAAEPPHYPAPPPTPEPTAHVPQASDFDLGGLMDTEPRSQVHTGREDHFRASTDLPHLQSQQVDFGHSQPVPPSQAHNIGHVADHFTQEHGGMNASMEPTLQSDAEYYASEYEDDEYEEYEVTGSRLGGFFKLVATLGLAIVTGAGLAYGYKFFVASDGKKVPAFIRADNKPAKIKPKDPGGKKFAHTKKAIYDRVGGPSKPSPRVGQDAPSAMPGISLSGAPAPESSGPSSGGTKKVRTYSVTPDGKLKPSEPLRPSRPANIDRIKQQASDVEIPGITVGGAKPAALVRPSTQKPSAPAKPLDSVARSLNDELARQASRPKPAAAKPAPVKPSPVKNTQVAALKPPAKPSVPVIGTSANGYVSQISARKSRLDALSAYADLQQRYRSILQNSQPDIQEANLGAKGVWYRVRIGPPGSKQAATDVCNKLKAAGHKGCFVRAY